MVLRHLPLLRPTTSLDYLCYQTTTRPWSGATYALDIPLVIVQLTLTSISGKIPHLISLSSLHVANFVSPGAKLYCVRSASFLVWVGLYLVDPFQTGGPIFDNAVVVTGQQELPLRVNANDLTGRSWALTLVSNAKFLESHEQNSTADPVMQRRPSRPHNCIYGTSLLVYRSVYTVCKQQMPVCQHIR